jgi:hypothetical protein
MSKSAAFVLVALAIALPATAQNWSLGAGSGPFVFGDFLERRLRPVNGAGAEAPTTLILSAATRAGLTIDVERALANRWALRLEGTFTRSDLSIKDSKGDDSLDLDAGEIDVTTLVLPVVFRINRTGALRFHLMGGPAYAMYKTSPPAHSGEISLSDRTSNEWGVEFGGGVAWWPSERFAVEGNLSDIVTTSPFSELDDPPTTRANKTHNVHTTVGVRWRF